MKFTVGDIVAFLDSVGTGTVLKTRGEEVLVEDENGFEDWYPQAALVIRKRIEVDRVERKDEVSSAADQSQSFGPNELVKDLHFNQLVDYPKNFTNYEMLQIQLREARKALDHARRAGIKKVILIHGIGEGRLKEEVHSMLERMDKLNFYDASYAKYGSGATEVELF